MPRARAKTRRRAIRESAPTAPTRGELLADVPQIAALEAEVLALDRADWTAWRKLMSRLRGLVGPTAPLASPHRTEAALDVACDILIRAWC